MAGSGETNVRMRKPLTKLWGGGCVQQEYSRQKQQRAKGDWILPLSAQGLWYPCKTLDVIKGARALGS